MNVGIICLVSVSLLVLIMLSGYFGMFFIMMLLVGESVNRRPYGSVPLKLRLVENADAKSSCPHAETFKEIKPAEILLA